MEKKYQCAKALLADVYQVFKRNKKEAFSVIIFVPEGMVSLLIGAKGHYLSINIASGIKRIGYIGD